jgi:hypothetical protein
VPSGEAQEGPRSLGLGGPSYAASLAARDVVCFVIASWRGPSRLVFARVNP